MAALSNDIYIGSVSDPIYHYDNARLELGGARGTFSLDVIGNELPIDTFSVTIRYDPLGEDMMVYAVKTDTSPWDGEYELYQTAERTTPPTESAALYVVAQTSPANYLSDVPYGTPVYWYISSAFFAKGYLKSVERIGKCAWKLTCISGVGLLDSKMHAGGLYNGQTLQTVLSSIIGSTVPYSFFGNNVKSIALYGHLPYDTARNNLHRVLFAVGAVLFKNNATTDYTVHFLGNAITDIPASRVSINGSVSVQLPATKAEVTEHGFFQTLNDETVTLFDNTGGGLVAADHQLVVFDKSPVYSLGVTGTLVVNESNCNYAIVTGTGTLTGKLYQHTHKIIELEDNPNNNQERVVRVTDNELVSAVNSRNVARRVLNYYKSTKTVKGKLLLQNERVGSYVQTVDAWGDLTQGYLHKIDVVPTSVKGANVEIIDGYVADANGNNYTHRVVLTGNGTFSVPDGVTDIRIILVGAGSGGQGGYDGQAGMGGVATIPPTPGTSMDVGYFNYDPDNPSQWPDRALYYTTTQVAKAGGAAGAGGTQGKVYVVDKSVTAGENITFASGVGGAGGDVNGGAGTAGTATTASSTSIGSLTSADGNENGYYDPLANTTYGTAGKNGYKGGAGGKSGNYDGCEGSNGNNGGSVAGFSGGAGGVGTGTDGDNYPAGSGLESYTFLANGSGGGGAAYGNAGGAGDTYSTEEWYVDGILYGIRVIGAAGGDGADALAPMKASYGNGGAGGNGGGSGGNASGIFCHHAYFVYEGTAMTPGGVVSSANAQGGAAGAGSKGGDGGDGCMIIYY